MRGWGLPEPRRARPGGDRVAASRRRGARLRRFMAVHPGVTVVTVFAGNPARVSRADAHCGTCRAGSGPATTSWRCAGARIAPRSRLLDATPDASRLRRAHVQPRRRPGRARRDRRRARRRARARSTRRWCSRRSGSRIPTTTSRTAPACSCATALGRDVSWWCYEDNGYKHIPGMLAWRVSTLFRRGALADARVPARRPSTATRKAAAVACYPSQLLALEDDWRIARQARRARPRAVLAPRPTPARLGRHRRTVVSCTPYAPTTHDSSRGRAHRSFTYAWRLRDAGRRY